MQIRDGLLILILVFSILLGIQSSNTWAAEVLKLGHNLPPALPVSRGAERFAQIVESKSGGAVVVKIYPAGTLGAGPRLMKEVEKGVIELAMVPNRSIVPHVKKAILLELPFLFSSYEEIDRFLDGKVGGGILELLSEAGLKGLGYFEFGFVGIASKKSAIKRIEDYKGLKIRIGTPKMIAESISLLGAQPIKLPLAEAYSALERGIADATLTTALSYKYLRYNEILPFLSQTNHSYYAQILIMNKARMDRLAPRFKMIVSEAAAEASRYERELSRSNEDGILKDMEGRGVRVVRNPDRESMRKTMEPIYENAKKVLECEDCRIFPWCCLW